MKFSLIKVGNRRKAGMVIALFAIAVFVYGLFIHEPAPVDDTKKVVTYSTDRPNETRPDNSFQWRGNPNDPKKITINPIGVQAYIQKVGVDQNKEVAVPTNLFLVGWFVDTVRPGQKGLSLIDGHVSGRRNDGVFKDLHKLKKGDQYSVELGNGKTISYRVINIKSVKVSEAVSVMFSQDPTVSYQLNLVTCSGSYDAQNRSYDERLVVMSEQIL